MKTPFIKHVLTLMKGTAIAQFLPILISPILTRLFTPEEFGVFAIYIATISILTPFINGRYELAIALPQEERKALSLFLLAFSINVLVTLISIGVVILTGEKMTEILTLQDSYWLYVLPLGLFLMGAFSSLTYLNNRWGRFSNLAKSKINQSTSMALIQLITGFLKVGSIGLIIGYLVGQIAAISKLGKNTLIIKKIKNQTIGKNDLLTIGKEYSVFPKYAMVTHSTEALSTNVPNLLLSKFFGTQYTGYYSLTTRTVNIPMSLVGKAVGDVFLSTASKIYREQGECKELYIKTFKTLALIPIIPFIFIFIFGEELFSLIFGKEWALAGLYTKILIPALYLQFISGPLSHMFIIAKRVKVEFYVQILILILSILAFVLGFYIYNSIEASLIMFSGALTIKYIMFILLSYSYAVKKIN